MSKYQRGGPVNGWILAALLVVALASGAMNLYQSRHHVTQIVVPTQYVPSGVVPRYADSLRIARGGLLPEDLTATTWPISWPISQRLFDAAP